jgi:general secretion pathway protein G
MIIETNHGLIGSGRNARSSRALQNPQSKIHNRFRRAFTLLEVIVVVTIIALLAMMVAPRLLQNIWKAKQKVASSEVRSIAQQLQLYLADNGMTRPSDDLDLGVLVPQYFATSEDLTDPWDRPYILVVPGVTGAEFDIVSYGANGEPGGEGEDKDVNSNIKE